MRERLASMIGSLATAVAELDARAMSGPEATALHDLFARAERLAVAGRTVCTSAIDRTGAFREAGHRSAAQFVAARTGTTTAAGAATVATSRVLERLPATREALVAGTLSVPQAAAIALGASADPTAESALLEAAASNSVRELRQKALMVRASAPGGEDLLEAIRATRYLKMWDDEDGALRLEGRLAPDDGAMVRAVLQARADELRRDGRRAGYPTSVEHASADALVGVIAGNAQIKTVVQIHVDAEAFERGALKPGERCEIAGTPISVASARRLAQDAWIDVVEHAGVDVRRVVTMGRNIPAQVRTAVDARDRKCAITSCPNSRRLEYDHRVARSEGGETSVSNVWKLCSDRCHYLKTHRGWVPVQRQGVWELVPPSRAP